MLKTNELKQRINDNVLNEKFDVLYVEQGSIEGQKERYLRAVEAYEKEFGDGDEVSICSAPGRTEICGNHTDHQHGKVLAGSINRDAIAVVAPTGDGRVSFCSEGQMTIVDLNAGLAPVKDEEESTAALVRGMAAGCKEAGYTIGGFKAYVTSDVLIGSGLSSSAAIETLIGTIFSNLYNENKITSEEIAKMGQVAENTYFGKPCGLMDQMACSVGGLCYIDFFDEKNPKVEPIAFNPSDHGYLLCITNTKGSHADLTDEYAAIPREMGAVAAYYGKKTLSEVDPEAFFKEIAKIREAVGDRPVLRAMHFFIETWRVARIAEHLKKDDIRGFLDEIKASGDSSFKYLQNVYVSTDAKHQNISVALGVSEAFFAYFDDPYVGVCRVHGGGFAGTVQAFVKKEQVYEYQKEMDSIFGEGACQVMSIRGVGGTTVI